MTCRNSAALMYLGEGGGGLGVNNLSISYI